MGMKFRYLELTMILVITACSNSNDQPANPSDAGDIVNPTVISTSVSIPQADTLPTSQPEPAKELEVTNGSVVYSKKHVIVNAANQWLAPGGFLSGAIFTAAGQDKVLAEIKQKKGKSNLNMSGPDILLKTAEVFTTGAYNLSSQGTQYIIHALGPDFGGSPYNTNIDLGYKALRNTYKNVYTEMDRLNKEQGVTSIGIIPISSGVYAGASNKTTLYTIMIEETLNAMQSYPALQPELYLFGKDEFPKVKALLPSTVERMTKSVALSSGAALNGISSAVSHLALMSIPYHHNVSGNSLTQGIAHTLGPIRFIGSLTQGNHDSLADTMVGASFGKSVLGIGLETGYRNNELRHYAVKAKSLYAISSKVSFGSSIGYMYENMRSTFSNGIRQFLNRFDVPVEQYIRKGIMTEAAIKYQSDVGIDTKITADAGLRTVYYKDMSAVLFAQISLNMKGMQSSAFIAKHEFGFNIGLNN